jgi:hypothetical protein
VWRTIAEQGGQAEEGYNGGLCHKIAEKGEQTGEERNRQGQAIKAGQMAGRVIVADVILK